MNFEFASERPAPVNTPRMIVLSAVRGIQPKNIDFCLKQVSQDLFRIGRRPKCCNYFSGAHS